MFLIEVYSEEAKRWYLWLDNVQPFKINAEITRAKKLYNICKVVRSKP